MTIQEVAHKYPLNDISIDFSETDYRQGYVADVTINVGDDIFPAAVKACAEDRYIVNYEVEWTPESEEKILKKSTPEYKNYLEDKIIAQYKMGKETSL